MNSKKKIAVAGGIVAGALGLILIARSAKGEPPPPPPPPPGSGNLYGTVKDELTGDAISGVLVELDGMNTTTNELGYYELLNLEPGTYDIRFSKTGYETRE